MTATRILFGRENRSTSLASAPSTLTNAIPLLVLRVPIHRTAVPLNLNVAIAPTSLDCFAVPPLQPNLGSLFVHVPIKLTAVVSDSSTSTLAKVGGGGGVPPAAGGGVPPSVGGGVPPATRGGVTTAVGGGVSPVAG